MAKSIITIELDVPDDFYEQARALIPYHDALQKVPVPDGVKVEHFTLTGAPKRRRKKAAE